MIKGKVVLVPFPFDDLSSNKVRPAVCLSEPIGAHRHIILGFVTSQPLLEVLESDVFLNSADPGFSETGLQVSSSLRLHRLMTVSATTIRRELGFIPSDIQSLIDAKLLSLFGLE